MEGTSLSLTRTHLPSERSMPKRRNTSYVRFGQAEAGPPPMTNVNRPGFHADSFVCDVTSSGVAV